MSPRHSEYLGISSESQIRNARNVRVNAQVTALITIFEVLGMCIIKMPHILVIKYSSFAWPTLFMLLYFVILPYAFLMNTTSNKNRIIEDGWMNVLKNIVSCYKCNVMVPSNIANEAAVANEASANEAPVASEKIIDPEKKPNISDISLVSKTTESIATKNTAVKPFAKSIGGEGKKPAIEMQKPTCSYKKSSTL